MGYIPGLYVGMFYFRFNLTKDLIRLGLLNISLILFSKGGTDLYNNRTSISIIPAKVLLSLLLRFRISF